jgi:hypothetical protein
MPGSFFCGSNKKRNEAGGEGCPGKDLAGQTGEENGDTFYRLHGEQISMARQ